MRVTLIVFVLMGILGSLSYYFGLLDIDNEELTLNEVNATWTRVLTKVQDDWRVGVPLNDPHLLKNCPEFKSISKKVDRALLSCRSHTFQCYYRGRENKFNVGAKATHYKISFPKKDKGMWSLPIDLFLGEEKRSFRLSSDCQKVDLPRQLYNRGEFINNKTSWHPGDVTYWVDKFLVRNIDLMEWKSDQQFHGDELFVPAGRLTVQEMKKYCAYRSGVVMSSMVADALTYYSTDKQSGIINKNLSPYPFSLRKSDVVQYKLMKNKDREIKQRDCLFIYGAECTGFPYLPVETLGWSGVGELLGGPLEYVENKTSPRRNLRLSSYYFSLRQDIHRAGVRGFWDGKGHYHENFAFHLGVKPIKNKYNVSFRCMGVRP